MNSPFLFILGCIILLGGACLGVYVGFWIMFVGGIVDIIDVFKSSFTSPWMILIGLLKISLCSLCGWLTFMFCMIVSAFFFSAAAK